MLKVLTSYTFDPDARTITSSSFSTIPIEAVESIINLTKGISIYNKQSDTTSSISGTVLTLGYLTQQARMRSTDKLQILYHDNSGSNDLYDSNGNLLVNLASKLDAVNDSITSYPFSHQYTRISTATTTTVKSDIGHIAGILVGTTAAGAITMYDNTAGSGTVIAALKASIAEGFYPLNVGFGTGLTIVTAAASDITVVWR